MGQGELCPTAAPHRAGSKPWGDGGAWAPTLGTAAAVPGGQHRGPLPATMAVMRDISGRKGPRHPGKRGQGTRSTQHPPCEPSAPTVGSPQPLSPPKGRAAQRGVGLQPGSSPSSGGRTPPCSQAGRVHMAPCPLSAALQPHGRCPGAVPPTEGFCSSMAGPQPLPAAGAQQSPAPLPAAWQGPPGRLGRGKRDAACEASGGQGLSWHGESTYRQALLLVLRGH